MVGRRIIEYRSDEMVRPIVEAKVAGVKSAPLAIDTTSTRWNTPLQERTNAGTYNDPQTLAVNYTSDTISAFSFPKVDYIIPTSNYEPESSSRRLKRYLLAEEALVSSLKNCSPEASSQELQIRALQNATALLGAHAKDAQERAAKLRLLLMDREVDRDTYESLQRERWMEEKRQLAVDHEVKVVRQHLESLSQSSKDVAVETRKDPVADANTKRQVNLARFFELSLARAPISTHKSKLPYIDRSPRRRTICHVSPMRLRTSSTLSTFSRPIKGHSRSVSLDGKRSSPTTRVNFGRPAGLPINTSLDVVTEDPATDQSNSHGIMCPGISDDAQIPNTPHLTSRWAVKSPEDSLNHPLEGVATIYKPMQARSKAEILADWATEDVSIPDYALNLMDNLDDILDSITLRSRLLSRSYRSTHSDGTVTRSPSPSSSAPSSPSRPTTPPRHRPFFSLDSSPSRLRLRKTPIPKRHSHGQLALFAIPEGSPSRDSISGSGSDTLHLQPSQAITHKSFFSRERRDTPPAPPLLVRGRESFDSYHECDARDQSPSMGLDGPISLANKVKRRFSILRRK